MTDTGIRAVHRIAFIGLGAMGAPMATRLAAAGHELVVQNRTHATAVEVGERIDASVTETPREAATTADLVVTMLADATALRGVLEGTDGLLAGLRPGTVVLDMGTTGPAAIHELAALVSDAGGTLVDAPVSGSVAAARAGELTILLGAPDDVASVVEPVLRTMGRSIHHLGDTGSGSVAKLAVNNIIFALGNAVAESLVLAERAGIDAETMYEVFADSAVAAPMIEYRRDAFLDPEGTPPAFAMWLAAKDLRMITELAARLDLPVAQAETNRRIIDRAVAAGYEDHDMADVAVHLRSLTSGRATGTTTPTE